MFALLNKKMKHFKHQGAVLKLLFASLIFLSIQALADGRQTTAIYSMVTVTVGTSNTLVSKANPARAYLLIQNNGSANIQVGFSKSTNPGIIVPPGGNYEPTKTPIDGVWLVSGSASQSVLVVEGQ